MLIRAVDPALIEKFKNQLDKCDGPQWNDSLRELDQLVTQSEKQVAELKALPLNLQHENVHDVGTFFNDIKEGSFKVFKTQYINDLRKLHKDILAQDPKWGENNPDIEAKYNERMGKYTIILKRLEEIQKVGAEINEGKGAAAEKRIQQIDEALADVKAQRADLRQQYEQSMARYTLAKKAEQAEEKLGAMYDEVESILRESLKNMPDNFLKEKEYNINGKKIITSQKLLMTGAVDDFCKRLRRHEINFLDFDKKRFDDELAKSYAKAFGDSLDQQGLPAVREDEEKPSPAANFLPSLKNPSVKWQPPQQPAALQVVKKEAAKQKDNSPSFM